jgi:hypothetical protein
MENLNNVDTISEDYTTDGFTDISELTLAGDATPPYTAKSPKLSEHSFSFHGGDVEILFYLHGRLAVGSVCSQAMMLASPVWAKLVKAPAKSSNIRQQLVSLDHDYEPDQHEEQQKARLDFRGDDAETLLILLNIAHLKFKDVPRKELPFKKLLNMAVLCHKYHCLSLVFIFAPGWLAGEEFQPLRDHHENWLFIAWVFGRDHVFESLGEKLVREVSIGPDGVLLTGCGMEFGEFIPQGILGKSNSDSNGFKT